MAAGVVSGSAQTKKQGARSAPVFIAGHVVYTAQAILPIKRLQSLKCFDSSSKTAFMTGSLVFVNDVFVSYAIDDAAGFTQHFGGSNFVAGFDSLANALDGRAQH